MTEMLDNDSNYKVSYVRPFLDIAIVPFCKPSQGEAAVRTRSHADRVY